MSMKVILKCYQIFHFLFTATCLIAHLQMVLECFFTQMFEVPERFSSIKYKNYYLAYFLIPSNTSSLNSL